MPGWAPVTPTPSISPIGLLHPTGANDVLSSPFCKGFLSFFLLPTTYYLPPTTYYLLPTTYHLLPTTYYLLMYLLPSTYYLHYHLPTTRTYYLLPTSCITTYLLLVPTTVQYLLPTTYHLLPTTYYLLVLPTAYYLLPATYYLLPTTYYLLPTTYYLLPTTYHLLPTTYHLLLYDLLLYSYLLLYGCPRTSKKVVRSEVFRKQASTFLIFYSSIRIRDVSGIPSDLRKSKRQGSFLYLLSWKCAGTPVLVRPTTYYPHLYSTSTTYLLPATTSISNYLQYEYSYCTNPYLHFHLRRNGKAGARNTVNSRRN